MDWRLELKLETEQKSPQREAAAKARKQRETVAIFGHLQMTRL